MLVNSFAHATYNQLSFQVLSCVATSSHAVLNIARRLCLIVLTVVVFQTPMDAYNWLGVVLAVGGVLLFGREKSRSARPGPFDAFLGSPRRDNAPTRVAMLGRLPNERDRELSPSTTPLKEVVVLAGRRAD